MSKISKASKIKRDSPAMEKLLADKGLKLKEFKPGDLIEGIVVNISHGEILVDVGAKSEGIITGTELDDTDSSHKTLKPGERVLAKVLQAENDQGYIVLSLRKAEKERNGKMHKMPTILQQ
jgi:small subunit ribosomal protein S1